MQVYGLRKDRTDGKRVGDLFTQIAVKVFCILIVSLLIIQKNYTIRPSLSTFYSEMDCLINTSTFERTIIRIALLWRRQLR